MLATPWAADGRSLWVEQEPQAKEPLKQDGGQAKCFSCAPDGVSVCVCDL